MSARSDPAQPVHHCGSAAAAVVDGLGGASGYATRCGFATQRCTKQPAASCHVAAHLEEKKRSTKLITFTG